MKVGAAEMNINESIDLMFNFSKSKNKKNEILLIKADISMMTLICIITDVLAWLRLEYKRERWIAEGRKISMRPLSLDDNYPWCQVLKVLVEEEELFKNNFIITNNKFDFAPNITEEERKAVRKKVFEEIVPIVIMN